MRTTLLLLFVLAVSACSDVSAGSRPSGTPYGAIVFTTGSPNARLRGPVGQIAIDRATNIAWQNTNGATAWSRFFTSALGNAATATETTAGLNTFTAALKGLCPASGGGTSNFLRADGTWSSANGTDPRITIAALASNYTNATTTTTEVTGLSTALTAGTYRFSYSLVWRNSSSSDGIRASVNFDGTQTSLVANYEGGAGNSLGTADQDAFQGSAVFGAQRGNSTAGLVFTSAVDTINLDQNLIVTGQLTVTVAGNLELWTAIDAGSSGTMTIMTGSNVVITKVL